MPWPMARAPWRFAEGATTYDRARELKARAAVNRELAQVTALAAPPLHLVGDRESLIASRSEQWRARTDSARANRARTRRGPIFART